jgi:Zn-dependent M28 family amino/carboxypeptidase
MIKITTTALLTLLSVSYVSAQKINTIINAGEVKRIETVLSSDDMHGRKTFSPDIDKAADFIASEFKATGLKTFPELSSYKQHFQLIKPVVQSQSLTADGSAVDEKNFAVVTLKDEINITEKSGLPFTSIKKGENLYEAASKIVHSKQSQVVIVDTSFTKYFGRITNYLKSRLFENQQDILFILSDKQPSSFLLTAKHTFQKSDLNNVVGVLPGKSKKDEFVVFSGHYDHLGIGEAVNGDSIYNGANDDAAGTTAVIMLAKYFKALKNNERTIIFVAFTAEEIGGFGSQYFSRQLAPEKVMAMFNIEMIGTESKWGKNSAYITGYEKTDMGDILSKNLKGSSFSFYPDPYTTEQLFYRSDNATLARLGVPAHTISTSKMDNEPNYHKPSDEIGTLDMNNMAEIIKSIALSSTSIVSGKDTPSRVKTEELR